MGPLRAALLAQLACLGAALNARSRLLRAGARGAALPPVHFVYATGCDDYQLLHSVVLDHSWRAAGNRGRLTRVVAGCRTPAERELLARSPLRGSPDFAAFFAEGDLALVPRTGERYPARSRPHALAQWLEATGPTEPVLALLDPDFAFLRPLSEHPCLARVRRGRMVSSADWWDRWDGTSLDCGNGTGDLGLDCLPSFNSSFEPQYQTGPIWLMHPADLRALLHDWASFTDLWPKVRDGLMREQYAFWLAAQRHGIPADFDSSLASNVPNETGTLYALHYFGSYGYGAWGFHKSLASSGWYAQRFANSVPGPLSCGAPLLQEPPAAPAGQPEAQAMVLLLPRASAALRAYREAYCPGEAAAFLRAGPAAFGLARTMQPRYCQLSGQLSGPATRYRVEPGVAPSWGSAQALGGDSCSPQAQAPLAAGGRA